MNREGSTFVEMVLGAALAAIIAILVVRLFGPMQRFFMTMRWNQQINTEARVGLDVLTKAMRQGDPGSLWICSCAADTPTKYDPYPYKACFDTASNACTSPPTGSPIPPNSQIEFDLPDGLTHYAIYWSGTAVVQMISQNPRSTTLPNGKVTSVARPLLHNVSELSFTGDSTDPAIINVSVQVASGNLQPVTFPTQVVHMVGTQ